MSTHDEFEADLRKMIGRSQVVAVVGSGVSAATTRRAPAWRGLIGSALERCREIGAPEAWCQLVRGQLAHGSADMLLAAAELVQAKLRTNGGGELARWLREKFEDLQPENPSVIQSLAALDIPLVTTNYDDLIEKVTGLKYITWRDPSKVSRWIRGDDRRVFHLHGHWDEPDSVVLGIRSYEAVKDNPHTRAVMQALGVTRSFLFVGCGDEGLADPNFGNFLTWLEAVETQARVEHRHYRLVRKKDVFEPRGRLFALPYGEEYDDLTAFLNRLRPEKAEDPSKKAMLTVPAPIASYLERLAGETAVLPLLGMGRSLQVELPIAEAYVPLRTRLARSMEERPADRFKEGHAEYEEDVALDEVFRRSALLGQRGVILLGEPGAGKTTAARQLAWRLASRQCLPQDLGLPAGMAPVLLPFRRLSRAALAEKNGLCAFLEEVTRCDQAPGRLGSPGPELWNRRDGGLLWILDGLDEVVEPGARKKVSGWVRAAMEGRPADWFLVTCRFQGYFREGVPLGPKFVEFHVRPLDDPQVEGFVRDWFGAAYRRLLGPTAQAEARANADSEEVRRILALPEYQTGRIRELCTNPLLLTILCIVFHEERKLPTGRAELYAHCVRVLLEYWRRDLYKSELGTELKPYVAEAAQAVLARVAWWMHQRQDRTEAPLDELAKESAQGQAQVAPDSGLGLDGHAFLQRMRDETGILAMSGEGRCGFLHLSFQEYLAAEYAAREGLAKELASKAAESWWREVALLSLRRSRPFCEAFFREMIEAGIVEDHPDLAERCLAESLFFTPEPFVKALEGSPPKKRAAAILRLLRDRSDQVPGLVEISRRLAASKDREARGFAEEILARRGILSAAAAEEPGGVSVDERTGLAFVTIPPGEFLMGSKEFEYEQPVRKIVISRGFRLGKYPVTNAQYARFLEAAGRSAKRLEYPEYWDDRRFNQPEQPVVGVSWDGARAFCEWAGGRLPTEAEWEYACRAGTNTRYSFGDDESKLGEYGWFDKNSGGQTQPVGAKKPNSWGLHDMHGNVWEWCQDCYGAYDAKQTVDPTGAANGEYRVVRGGSWGNQARSARSAIRGGNRPAYRDHNVGFRLVLR